VSRIVAGTPIATLGRAQNGMQQQQQRPRTFCK